MYPAKRENDRLRFQKFTKILVSELIKNTMSWNIEQWLQTQGLTSLARHLSKH